jgi:hypothetical protein
MVPPARLEKPSETKREAPASASRRRGATCTARRPPTGLSGSSTKASYLAFLVEVANLRLNFAYTTLILQSSMALANSSTRGLSPIDQQVVDVFRPNKSGIIAEWLASSSFPVQRGIFHVGDPVGTDVDRGGFRWMLMRSSMGLYGSNVWARSRLVDSQYQHGMGFARATSKDMCFLSA